MPDTADITIRPFREGDVSATAKLYFQSVREGTVAYYDDAQRQAWAPEVPDDRDWGDKLKGQRVFIAEQSGTMAGFMTLVPDGEIDLAFVAPAFIGKGVAWKLYQAALTEARNLGLTRLSAHASYLARPFFERQGWSVIKEQTVIRNDVELTNFVMEKQLS